jgi:hypothetical protein
MSIVALDVGYSAVKAIRDNGAKVTFPSVVGNYTASIYNMNQDPADVITLEDGSEWLVGEAAMERSGYKTSRRDADWIGSQMWRVLVCAALARLHSGPANVKMVTGLPLEHYRGMREPALNALKGEHRFKTGDGRWQTVTIEDARVMTQAFGAYASGLLSDNGKRFVNETYKAGRVGVLDIGGNTINALCVDKMRELTPWTRGDGLGLLKALDAIARAIGEAHKGLNPTAHEVAGWLANGNEFTYHGKPQDLQPYRAQFIKPLASMAVGFIADVWPEPGRLAAIILTGGGALALGQAIKAELEASEVWPPVVIPTDPIFDNASGYLKYGRALWE